MTLKKVYEILQDETFFDILPNIFEKYIHTDYVRGELNEDNCLDFILLSFVSSYYHYERMRKDYRKLWWKFKHSEINVVIVNKTNTERMYLRPLIERKLHSDFEELFYNLLLDNCEDEKIKAYLRDYIILNYKI